MTISEKGRNLAESVITKFVGDAQTLTREDAIVIAAALINAGADEVIYRRDEIIKQIATLVETSHPNVASVIRGLKQGAAR